MREALTLTVEDPEQAVLAEWQPQTGCLPAFLVQLYNKPCSQGHGARSLRGVVGRRERGCKTENSTDATCQ